MKSLFIRCSETTYTLAHALAKKENRSLNKQIIHMIHSLAEEKNIESSIEHQEESPRESSVLSDDTFIENVKQSETTEPFKEETAKWGLTRLAETRKQATDDQ
tara:strand:- start:365 stop:673 length:309 start_codon:yes stop_codon:yes gene_type:complete